MEQALKGDDVEIPWSFYFLPLLIALALIGLPMIYRKIWLGLYDLIPVVRYYRKGPTPPPGYRQLGRPAHRNLSKDFTTTRASNALNPDQDNPAYDGKVLALFIYPVKSCFGIEVPEAEISQTGLKYDRQFCFAQLTTDIPKSAGEDLGSRWNFITQRTHPALTLVKTNIWLPEKDSRSLGVEGESDEHSGILVVSFPFTPNITMSWQGLKTVITLMLCKLCNLSLSAEPQVHFQIPLSPSQQLIKRKVYPRRNVRIWRDWPHALDLESEIPAQTLAQLKWFLGITNPMTMMCVDTEFSRPIYKNAPTEEQIGYQASTGFADSYPISMQNMASIIDMEARVPRGALFTPDARRYRANIYISGPPAYSEDNWTRLKISDHVFYVSCRITRCKLPNTNPETAEADARGNQPLSTMSKYRAIDEGGGAHRPCLGMHMVPAQASIGASVHVSDSVQVLKTGNHWFVPEATAEYHRPIY